MRYEFFLSYSRANNDAYLQRFYSDLCDAVRTERGLGKDQEVGFFDQQDIELGDQWDDTIVEALQTSKVVLALTSAAYFKSDYCGKEWALFAQRLSSSQRDPNLRAALIKPLIWSTFASSSIVIPDIVAQCQMTIGDPDTAPNKKGLRAILMTLNSHQDEYTSFVLELAQQIVLAADKCPLARLPRVPALKDIPSAFQKRSPYGERNPTSTSSPGVNHVRFTCVAAHPSELPDGLDREPYLETGAGDWRPFYPENQTRVLRLAQSIVASDELDYSSDELLLGNNFMAEIDRAWQQRQVVVIVVDRWSLPLKEEFRERLKALDDRSHTHCSVLVPRHVRSSRLELQASSVDTLLSSCFFRRAHLMRNPMFYRDDLESVDDFKSALREVVIHLREAIRKHASVEMPIPYYLSKATVSGSSTRDEHHGT
jgi:FxsC-like protein